jgi:methylation protein EvaC
VDVAKAVDLLLKPDGFLVFEDPYLGDVIGRNSFDQYYDEHVFMFSALSVSKVFQEVGLYLFDAKPQDTHGGSMRYYFSRRGTREVQSSVHETIQREESTGLGRLETQIEWAIRVRRNRDTLVEELDNLKSAGNTIAGYAATSKSTTVLNYCGITAETVHYIADTTKEKMGLYTPGSHIPVVAETRFIEEPPDVALLFAWNHQQEIFGRHGRFAAGGGKWLTHTPRVSYIEPP